MTLVATAAADTVATESNTANAFLTATTVIVGAKAADMATLNSLVLVIDVVVEACELSATEKFVTFDAVADSVNDPAMLAVTSRVLTAVKLCVTIDISVMLALLLATAFTVNVPTLVKLACAVNASELAVTVVVNALLRLIAVSLSLAAVVD